MQIRLNEGQIDVHLYNKYNGELYDIPVEQMNPGEHYFGFTKIGGQDRFLKFRSKTLCPEEGLHRLDTIAKANSGHRNFPLYYGYVTWESWNVMIYESLPGKSLGYYLPASLTLDDGLAILDQTRDVIVKLLQEDLITGGKVLVDFCIHNFVYDKESWRLWFVDYGFCSTVWPNRFFCNFLCTLETLGAIDSYVVENCVDQYFDILYDCFPLDLTAIQKIESECSTSDYGAPPYESLRITTTYWLSGSRDTTARMTLLNLGNLHGKNVLDLGCNIGGMCVESARRAAKVIVGYEKNATILQQARKLAKELHHDSILYFEGDVGELTVENVLALAGAEKFDIIYYFSVWTHMKNKGGFKRFLRELPFDILYWEFHAHWLVKGCREILTGLSLFRDIQFLGYSDNYKRLLNSRPLFKCEK